MSRAALRWTAPVGLVVVAVVVAADTLSYPSSLVPGAPGPAFFPRLLAGLLFALGLALARRAARAGAGVDAAGSPASGSARPPPPRHAGDGAGAPAGDVTAPGGLDARRVAGGVAAIAGFLLLAPRTDTFVLLPLLLAALMALMGERRRLPLVAVPLAFTLFVYVVFYRALGVAVPTSLF